jgi:hypothetical protein
MIWFLFARWPGYAAAVAALVVGALLISLGILFLMASYLVSFGAGLFPGAVGMIAVGAVLVAIVGVWPPRPLPSQRVRPPPSE